MGDITSPGSVSTVRARSGLASAWCAPPEILVVVIYNLGFAFDGETLYVRLVCPNNRTQPLVSYEHMMASKQRRNRRYRVKLRDRSTSPIIAA